MIDFVVPDAADGRRLDAVVRELTGSSQKNARRLGAIGAVAIDGVVAAPAARVRSGQRVSVCDEHLALMLELGLSVAFADRQTIVVHKPPGLAVHQGPLVDDSVADRLQLALPEAGLAQRLDREASGLLLCGRTREAVSRLGTAMENGAIERCYEAVAHGVIDADEQTIDLPLSVTDEPRGDRPKTIVDEQGQRSISHVRVLARRRDATLVSVRIETGRTHQIRAHLAAIAHPILGDPRYGDAHANARARATHGVARTLLHGAELRFPADDGQPTTVRAFREPDLARLFRTR